MRDYVKELESICFRGTDEKKWVMKWIKYKDEKPQESGSYFCKGKKGKAVLYYNSFNDEWDIDHVAQNHFTDDYIEWIKE